MAYPDAWQETFLMTLTESGGSNVEIVGNTEGLGVKLGEKGISQIVLNNNGRIAKFDPEDITEITFDEYTLGVDSTNGLVGLFLGDTSDTTQPISVTNLKTRKKVRLAIMWTQDSNATSGAGASSAGNAAFRLVFLDGYLTTDELSFDDKILKSSLTFKVLPYNKSGTGRIQAESTDGTDSTGLTALSSY